MSKQLSESARTSFEGVYDEVILQLETEESVSALPVDLAQTAGEDQPRDLLWSKQEGL